VLYLVEALDVLKEVLEFIVVKLVPLPGFLYHSFHNRPQFSLHAGQSLLQSLCVDLGNILQFFYV